MPENTYTYKATPAIISDTAIRIDEEYGMLGFAKRYCSMVVETREVAVRAALIKLGWTPPKEG